MCKWPSSHWKPATGESSHVFLLSSICTPDSVQHMSATVISPVIPVPSSDSNKGIFHVAVNSKWHQGSGVQSFMSDYRNSLVEGICPATANSSSSTQHSHEAQFTFSFQTQENRNSTGSENACRGTDAGRDRKFVFWPSTVWERFFWHCLFATFGGISCNVQLPCLSMLSCCFIHAPSVKRVVRSLFPIWL